MQSNTSPHQSGTRSGMSDRQRDVRAVQQARMAAKQKKRIEINQDAEIIREGKGKLNILEILNMKLSSV